jgi:hypothetical protein
VLHYEDCHGRPCDSATSGRRRCALRVQPSLPLERSRGPPDIKSAGRRHRAHPGLGQNESVSVVRSAVGARGPGSGRALLRARATTRRASEARWRARLAWAGCYGFEGKARSEKRGALRLCDRAETGLSLVRSASLAKGATFAALSKSSARECACFRWAIRGPRSRRSEVGTSDRLLKCGAVARAGI